MGTATDVVIPVHAKGLRPGASSRSRLGIRSEPEYPSYVIEARSEKRFLKYQSRNQLPKLKTLQHVIPSACLSADRLFDFRRLRDPYIARRVSQSKSDSLRATVCESRCIVASRSSRSTTMSAEIAR
jgi:hypothetical protein